MYSYYAMALLKMQCPWKKFLTQAQLLQFTAVLLFSFTSIFLCTAKKTWGQYAAHLVQDFEMTSLFVLFIFFYRKTYQTSKRGEKKTSNCEPRLVESELPEDASVDTVLSASSDSSRDWDDNTTSAGRK